MLATIAQTCRPALVASGSLVVNSPPAQHPQCCLQNAALLSPPISLTSPRSSLQGGAPCLPDAGAKRRTSSRAPSATMWSDPQPRQAHSRPRAPGAFSNCSANSGWPARRCRQCRTATACTCSHIGDGGNNKDILSLRVQLRSLHCISHCNTHVGALPAGCHMQPQYRAGHRGVPKSNSSGPWGGGALHALLPNSQVWCVIRVSPCPPA